MSCFSNLWLVISASGVKQQFLFGSQFCGTRTWEGLRPFVSAPTASAGAGSSHVASLHTCLAPLSDSAILSTGHFTLQAFLQAWGASSQYGSRLSSKKHSQVGAAKLVTELRKPQSVTHRILLVKKVLRPAQVCKGRGIKISPLDCCGEQSAHPSERERRHGWRPPWGLATPWTKRNRCVGRIHPGATSVMSLNCQACVELDLTLFVVNGPARERSK